MRQRHNRPSGALAAIGAAAILWLAQAGPAIAEGQPYRVKLTDISIPDGASLGDVRRSFQPFPNWTLICDENLKARVKICNVTQTFADADGATVFSWSLAATEGGEPVFILRVPAHMHLKGPISVKPAKGGALSATVQACDASTCIATIPLNRTLSGEIAAAEPVTVSYEIASGPVTLSAPLNGLARAVAAID